MNKIVYECCEYIELDDNRMVETDSKDFNDFILTELKDRIVGPKYCVIMKGDSLVSICKAIILDNEICRLYCPKVLRYTSSDCEYGAILKTYYMNSNITGISFDSLTTGGCFCYNIVNDNKGVIAHRLGFVNNESVHNFDKFNDETKLYLNVEYGISAEILESVTD